MHVYLSGRNRRRTKSGVDQERTDRREQGDDRLRHYEHCRVFHLMLPYDR
jgi:hypothetical protein